MWKKFKKWLTGPTPEEAYQNGRSTARLEIIKADDDKATAEHLFNLASGGFNTTTAHREYDRGVNDQLIELGFKHPEENW